MIYIKGNHVMMTYGRITDNIINTTGYPPQSVYGNIILLRNGKLYMIVSNYYYSELSEIKLESGENYCISHGDFTDKFARINSDYYKIPSTKMIYDFIPSDITEDAFCQYNSNYYRICHAKINCKLPTNMVANVFIKKDLDPDYCKISDAKIYRGTSSGNATDTFVKINSDYYKISNVKIPDVKIGGDDNYSHVTINTKGFVIHDVAGRQLCSKKFLRKIPIVAKNSQCIIRLHNYAVPKCYYYYYVDTDNNLVLHDEANESRTNNEVNNNESDTSEDFIIYDGVDKSDTLLNTDINTILYYCVNDANSNDSNVSIVVRKKKSSIMCYTYNLSTMIDEYVIDRHLSAIEKTFDRFIFCNSSLYEFTLSDGKICTSNINLDIEGYITDANYYNSILLVTTNENKVVVITKEKYRNYISRHIDCDSHFGKGILSKYIEIKSAIVHTPGSRTKRAI
jgi:hypothetical protein